MTAGLPPEIVAEEIEIRWKTSEKGTRVKVTLGGATVIVKADEESAEALPWLIQALPNALNAAYDAMNQEES